MEEDTKRAIDTLQTAIFEIAKDIERLKRDRQDIWEYISTRKNEKTKKNSKI